MPLLENIPSTKKIIIATDDEVHLQMLVQVIFTRDCIYKPIEIVWLDFFKVNFEYFEWLLNLIFHFLIVLDQKNPHRFVKFKESAHCLFSGGKNERVYENYMVFAFDATESKLRSLFFDQNLHVWYFEIIYYTLTLITNINMFFRQLKSDIVKVNYLFISHSHSNY